MANAIRFILQSIRSTLWKVIIGIIRTIAVTSVIIVGKFDRVLYSFDSDKCGWKSIRWKRIFEKL